MTCWLLLLLRSDAILLRVADDDLTGIAKSPTEISNWLASGDEWGRFGTFTQAQAKKFKDTNLIRKGAKN